MTTYLLDANVLIALTVREHVDHERASAWARDVNSFAVCPVVEGALLRFVVRLGGTIRDGRRALGEIARRPGYEFWPDGISYREVRLEHVIGHRQVTDAYLASLAAARPGSLLATFDEPLAGAFPDCVQLVPHV